MKRQVPLSSTRSGAGSRVSKSRHIDQLYGLEPVYEPGQGRSGGLLPEEFVPVQCPYCGERLETRVDLTIDEPAYIAIRN